MEHNNKHRKESHCNLFQTQLAKANSRERSLQASVQSTKTDIQKMCHERCEIWQFVGSRATSNEDTQAGDGGS